MNTPISQQDFKTLLHHLSLDLKLNYIPPRILIKNTSLQAL